MTEETSTNNEVSSETSRISAKINRYGRPLLCTNCGRNSRYRGTALCEDCKAEFKKDNAKRHGGEAIRP